MSFWLWFQGHIKKIFKIKQVAAYCIGHAITIALFLLTVISVYAAENEPLHIKAVMLAREGETTKALDMLKEFGETNNWPEEIANDYAVILVWDKQDKKAYEFFKKHINRRKAPPYVLENMAKACQNLTYIKEAQQLYLLLKQKDPDNVEAHVGWGSIELEIGDPHQIPIALKTIWEKHPDHIGLNNTLGGAYYAIGYYADSLKYYNRVLDVDPNDQTAIHGQALSVKQLNGAFQSEIIAEKHPKALTQDELFEIKMDQAATLVNWGKEDADLLDEYDERYRNLDTAISQLKELREQTSDSNKKQRISHDLMVAYNFRTYHNDAVAEYEALLQQGLTIEDIPSYALEGVGNSYLRIRQPKQAIEISEYLLNKNRENIEAIRIHYRALMDMNKLQQAMEFIENVYKTFNIWIPLLNGQHLNKSASATHELKEISFYDAGLLGAADESSKQMIQQAPLNPTIRNLRGNVLKARGLPRTAQTEFKINLSTDPRNNTSLLGKARTHLMLHEPEEAEKIMEIIHKNYPESEDLKNFKEEWKSYNSRQFVSDTTSSYGGGPEIGSHTLTTDNRLYSQPIANHYRAFISQYYQSGKYQEGNLDRFLEGIGVEYRNRNVTLLAEINTTHYTRSRIGSSVSIGYSPNDHFHIGIQADLVSRQTPGRAMVSGIHSDFYAASLAYYKNESFELGVNGFFQDFSDGNQWNSLGGYGIVRVLEKPHKNLDLRVDINGRSAKKDNVPYYSPKRDLSADLSAIFTQNLYRCYEQAFTHKITANVGNYWQKGYGNDLTFGITYEHVLRYDNWYDVGYAYSRKRRTYDGNREYESAFYLKLDIRF